MKVTRKNAKYTLGDPTVNVTAGAQSAQNNQAAASTTNIEDFFSPGGVQKQPSGGAAATVNSNQFSENVNFF